MKRLPDFSMRGTDSILRPEHTGLVNGQLTLNGWPDDVASIRGIYAPPFYSNDFQLNVRFNGQRINASKYTWSPDVLTRYGTIGNLQLTTRLIPYLGQRAAILQINVSNRHDTLSTLSIQLEVTGSLNRRTHWGFSQPRNALPAHAVWNDQTFSLNTEGTRLAVAASCTLMPRSPLYSGLLDAAPITVLPSSTETLYIFIALASPDESDKLLKAISRNPELACTQSHSHWCHRVEKLYDAMPSFTSDTASWQRLYDRSLLHFLLNEWNVPEFKLHPYYSTGSVNGGCIGGYLWNYGSPWRLWSILSPESAREHLKAYLSVDLNTCFAIQPDDCAPFGAYYPINHEKVIFLTHAYVMDTRDTTFLHQTLQGKRIIDHIIDQAMVWDDLSKPAILVNYGDGNHHLELLRNLRYDGILPDLNLRRCICFQLAAELCDLADTKPPVDLRKRAIALKTLIRSRLYDEKAGWYRAIDCQGKNNMRYTMQMFKALGWNNWALDKPEEDALIKHLMNKNEFLGECGIHSLSKQDPAYDEFDIDNGGPGACPSFAPAIIERLYQSGHATEAEEIFKRMRWLADFMPYWGDSQRADIHGYCWKTPLQCDIEGATLAQAFIFGMFGINVRKDFSIEVTPHLPADTNKIALTNIRLAGWTFSIKSTRENGVTLTADKLKLHCPNGGTLRLPPMEPCMSMEMQRACRSLSFR
ncbi:MAG: hypothetical protein J6X55_08445 [Victivallales bacterium]|nr:hypothetical protein [Victivallales bacterium]